MFRQILALALLSVLVSCGSSRSHVQTSRNKTPRTATAKKPKPAIKTSTDTKTGTASKPGRTSETLEATSKVTVYSDMVKQYVLDFKDTAKDNMRRHGIPASITLAQGILESGAGTGTLCKEANNHFGIKCHTGWTGDTYNHDDDSEQECFRKYKDPAESYNDHSMFLTTRGRYAALFKLDKDDYEAWAKGLKAAGYATDPKYPDKLIDIIIKYDLASYDAEVLNKTYVKPTVKQPDTAIASMAGGGGTYKVTQGDTLYSISKKHNLTVDELMRMNGLSDNAISIGQVLKVK